MENEKLKEGIAAFKAGDKITARNIMVEIIKTEPNNEIAWLWLAACVEKVQDRKFCLSKALEINPNNQNARKALEQLETPPQPSIEEIVSIPRPQPDTTYDILKESAGGIDSISEQIPYKKSKVKTKKKITTSVWMLIIIALGFFCTIVIGGILIFLNIQNNFNIPLNVHNIKLVASQAAQMNALYTALVLSKTPPNTNTPTLTSSPTITPSPTATITPTITTTPTDIGTPTMTLLPTVTLPPMEFAECIPKNTERTTGKVTNVVDGDTIEVNINGTIYKVRYIGMDTPETNQTFGSQATAKKKELVDGKTVTLVKDVSETDQYQRLLRYVLVGNTFVNYELVKTGFASVATYPPDVACQTTYLEAESTARNGLLGLWAPIPAPAQTQQQPQQVSGSCDPAYPGVCIPPPPPDLDCGDISFRMFTVLPPDPHRFDGDHDGIGCEN